MQGFAQIEIAWWFDQIWTLGEGPLPTYGFNHAGNNEAMMATWILPRGEHYPFLDNIHSYHPQPNLVDPIWISKFKLVS